MLARSVSAWFDGGLEGALPMSELWLPSEAQMRRVEPYFAPLRGVPEGR